MKNPHLKRRILIVGEGRETEYNYFVGFRNAFRDQLNATATSVKVARGKGKSATQIVKHAIFQRKLFKPDTARGDRVFLLMDTEGAGRESELPAAERLAKKEKIEIIYSSPAFEYWLLCHFDSASRRIFKDCHAVITELNNQNRWSKVSNSPYDKSDDQLFSRLSEQLTIARAQSLEVDLHHSRTGNARRRNPSTQVYELIATLIGVRTGEKCPVDGKWILIGKSEISCQVKQGEGMPNHDGDVAHWQI